MNGLPQGLIRVARPAEAESLAALDEAAWPPGLATSADGFRSRIATFAAAQLVAVVQPASTADDDAGEAGARKPDTELADQRTTGTTAGTAPDLAASSSAQRITAEFLQTNCHSYRAMTDDNRFAASHHPEGEIWQLVGVASWPVYRGLQLGRRLVDEQIALARRTPGIQRIIGFTRPAGYHRCPQLTIEEYLQAVMAGLGLPEHEAVLNLPAGETATAGGAGKPPRDAVLAFHLRFGARIVSVHAGFRPNDTQSLGYGVLIEYPLHP